MRPDGGLGGGRTVVSAAAGAAALLCVALAGCAAGSPPAGRSPDLTSDDPRTAAQLIGELDAAVTSLTQEYGGEWRRGNGAAYDPDQPHRALACADDLDDGAEVADPASTGLEASTGCSQHPSVLERNRRDR